MYVCDTYKKQFIHWITKDFIILHWYLTLWKRNQCYDVTDNILTLCRSRINLNIEKKNLVSTVNSTAKELNTTDKQQSVTCTLCLLLYFIIIFYFNLFIFCRKIWIDRIQFNASWLKVEETYDAIYFSIFFQKVLFYLKDVCGLEQRPFLAVFYYVLIYTPAAARKIWLSVYAYCKDSGEFRQMRSFARTFIVRKRYI